ncbi:MAG: biotin--[acetyl-CoA-carboxylase] ligase [Chloroflexota bacterium]
MPSPFIARREQFEVVGSTNDVVRGWLDHGTPEVCLAVARAQTAGRGREGRSWLAPPGASLLASLGFRPRWLPPDRLWRLPAVVSLAMAEAAEDVAGLTPGSVLLKWPNDLAIAGDRVRKLAGVLGETDGIGSADPRVVVGIGLNAEWAAADFPDAIAPTMTSLSEVAGGQTIELDVLLSAFLERLEPRVEGLREGRFDAAQWAGRQLTTGRMIRLERPGGSVETVRASGVDVASGALLVASAGGHPRPVVVGEVRHVRVADPAVV